MESLFWALRKLGELLVQEVKHLAKAREKMEWLKDEMEWMQKSIYDADRRYQFADEIVKQWVKEIRNAVSLAECIVAKYAFESRKSSAKYNPKLLHDIYKDITKLENNLQNIKDHAVTYRILDVDVNPNPKINKIIEQFRGNARSKKAEEVIGLEAHIDSLIEQLRSDKPGLYVISIVGMGGVGKTTLASLVFENNKVRELFPIRVWVDLSQNYNEFHGTESLLHEIARQTNLQTEDLKNKGTFELSERVKRNLDGKRYVIVMDDMWEEVVWDLIEAHLPDESNGSRIMITTRNENVARRPAIHFPPCRLQCLDREQSWNIFRKSIFETEERLNKECTGLLRTQAEKLVDKCGGSPLALDILVKCLRGKDRTCEAWDSALRREKWLHSGSRCMETLKLSYTCLPIHLKWCFLYLSAFPEGSNIEVERLIKLWAAEGFVETEEDNNNDNVEDIAMSYLEQLKERYLVEVIEKKCKQSVNGRVSCCTIHNLHRLLSVAEAKSLNFMDFCVKAPINNNPHRLAVLREASSTVMELDLVRTCSSLRTLLDFRSEKASIRCKDFSLLKVLDLENAKINCLPKQIGSMICLHYLSIKNTLCEELPESIINIPSLETLDCRVKGKFSMPNEIWKIGTLTHVYGNELCCDCDVMCAEKLKTLESVFLNSWITKFTEAWKQLRVLHIHITKLQGSNQISNDFWSGLQDLPALESLYFDLYGYTFMNMTCRARKFPKLQSLTLEKFEYEEWEVQESSMVSLKTLNLSSCTKLRELPFGLHGCPELQKLNCVSMSRTFREWYQNQGAKDFSYVTWTFSPSI